MTFSNINFPQKQKPPGYPGGLVQIY